MCFKMSQLFNLESYYSRLRTRRLGRPCIYLEQVESTIEVAASKPPDTIILAKEQLKGRGQRNNVWHSPTGCAMGSIRLACRKISPLASRLCFLQHIMIIVAAKTLEQIDENKLGKNQIKLKWPNDLIYTNSNHKQILKIGGVLVYTKENIDEYDITLSFGLNVSNKEPTTCINDIIGSSEKITIDTVVAEMMNNLEQYTYDLDEKKFQQLKMDYTERCLQMNKVIEDEFNGFVKVKEVSDDGYLIGVRCADQKLCTITKVISHQLIDH